MSRLALAGVDSRATWRELGAPPQETNQVHPIVVLAIEPSAQCPPHWLNKPTWAGAGDVTWGRCVLPAEEIRKLHIKTDEQPLESHWPYPPETHFRLTLVTHDPSLASLHLVIDQNGELVEVDRPSSFSAAEGTVDPDALHLGAWPPISPLP